MKRNKEFLRYLSILWGFFLSFCWSPFECVKLVMERKKERKKEDDEDGGFFLLETVYIRNKKGKRKNRREDRTTGVEEFSLPPTRGRGVRHSIAYAHA